MLELKNITKDYVTGDMTVHALKGINLIFRKSEFVSILGPSGCGKTTMLNIIGGLDRYTEGDLLINGRSTKDYKASDWDTYRNSSIGFVFQNYNLIPHLSVLGNVELALTLSGENKTARREKAEAALIKVGLAEQIHKRPNQLSGGQMQRVAIARAIVNDPEIILADEPTGALDSVTSVQISDLLKEISRDRLIIMVTHNDALAEQYSTRIVRLHDGEIVGDTNPYHPSEQEKVETILAEKKQRGEYIAEEDTSVLSAEALRKLDAKAQKDYRKQQKRQQKERARAKKRELRKTSMSFATALSLSGRNLATKKGRSVMVSIAGSIGIIGIALVLSISNGFSQYINKMQTDTLAGFPVTIGQTAMDINTATSTTGGNKSDKTEFPDLGELNIHTTDMSKILHINNISPSYIDYLKQLDSKYYNDIQYTYDTNFTVLTKLADGSVGLVEKGIKQSIGMGGAEMSQTVTVMSELLPNSTFMNSQYDVLYGDYPSAANQAVLVVDKYNQLDEAVLDMLGIAPDSGKKTIQFADLLGKEYRVVTNNDLYEAASSQLGTPIFKAKTNYETLYNSKNNFTFTVTGILRIKPEAPLNVINTGLYYTPALTEALIENGISSDVSKAQLADPTYSYSYGAKYEAVVDQVSAAMGLKVTEEFLFQKDCQTFGITKTPASVYIYPTNFDTKTVVTDHLDAWNVGKGEADKILYTDASALLTSTMGNMVNIISYVLVAFAAVSLVVSSIMIGIITYVSVIERTKEIGVLRSIGARKKDISRVFNAETLLIGFVAGVFGVFVSFLLTFPMNWIINAVIAANGASSMISSNLAILNPLHGLILIVVSTILTLIAGLIPSRIAAKKDPVVALRTE